MVSVSGSENRYMGIRFMAVPTAIASRMVSAPRNLPMAICHGARGSVIRSSMVLPLHSPANRRMEIAGATTVSSTPMFWKVSSIVAVPPRNTL